MSTPWSELDSESFLRDGLWAIGQGAEAPDRRLLRYMLSLIGPVSLIDVGCGSGIELQGLQMYGPKEVSYTGYDFTAEFVDYCRRCYPNDRFEIRDATELGDQELADVVSSRAMLEHIVDGEKAFRGLLEASRILTVVSWFIRPSWCEDEVGVEQVGEFVHHTYSARSLTQIANEYGGLYRFDYDHHSTKASTWVVIKDPEFDTAFVTMLHDFVSSDEFVDSLLPVPPDPQEKLNALKEVLWDVSRSYDGVLAVAERVEHLLDVLGGTKEALDEVIEVFEDEHKYDLRTVSARATAALAWRGGLDDVAKAVKEASEAKTRAEAAAS